LGYDFPVNYDRVRIGADGRISPVGSDPRRARFEIAGEYYVHAGPPGTLLLSKPQSNEVNGGRVLMMGEVISRMTVVEVINIIISTNWRGELYVSDGKGTRALTIDQGALKHAQTEHEGERLGQQLIGEGLLSRKDLEHYLREKPLDRRLGQLLVERSVLTTDVLFKQLQRQAETIFYAMLLSDSGHYWFTTPKEQEASPAATVHLPLQAMLMEGVQRLDEMALFRERIPHNRLFPSVTSHSVPPGSGALDLNAMLLLELCDGARDIDELARVTAFGEFPTLKLVYGLLRTGQVELLAGPSLDPRAAELLVRLFNDIMRDIFLAVATYGSSDSVRRAISRWIEGSPYHSLLGSEVDVDGTLHAPTIVRRLEQEPHGKEPLRTLHQALHELIAYSLFTVSNSLPRHEEQSLSRDVNHRLKQLKL
jgi:hypothetical protein